MLNRTSLYISIIFRVSFSEALWQNSESPCSEEMHSEVAGCSPIFLFCKLYSSVFSPSDFILFYFLFFCWRIYSFIFPFIFISWRLITLRYCSGFCHTLTWISHGFTCVPHPDPRSRLPLHPIPLEWNIYKIKQSRCTCANNTGNFRSHPKSTHKTHMRRLVIDSLSENSFPSFISIIR